MSKSLEMLNEVTYILVIEGRGGLIVQSLNGRSAFNRVTKAMKQTHWEIDPITCWVTYQSWLDWRAVRRAVQHWYDPVKYPRAD